MDYLLNIVLGQIPEAIYFSLFMLYAKGIKHKGMLFIIVMTLEYLLLHCVLRYNIYQYVVHFIMVYTTLKVFYKDKTQIIDVFVFLISVILLGIINVPILLCNNFINNIYVCCIVSKIIAFIVLFLSRKQLNRFYIKYCQHWNRNDKKKRKIKSLTVRNISVVFFNVTFYLMNIVLIYVKLKYGGV